MVTVTADAPSRSAPQTTGCTMTAPPTAGQPPAGRVVEIAGRDRPGRPVGGARPAERGGAGHRRDRRAARHHDRRTARHLRRARRRRRRGGRDFSTCVTSDGVLGSFTGTLDGTAVDVAMTRLPDAGADGDFDLPHGRHGRRPPLDPAAAGSDAEQGAQVARAAGSRGASIASCQARGGDADRPGRGDRRHLGVADEVRGQLGRGEQRPAPLAGRLALLLEAARRSSAPSPRPRSGPRSAPAGRGSR